MLADVKACGKPPPAWRAVRRRFRPRIAAYIGCKSGILKNTRAGTGQDRSSSALYGYGHLLTEQRELVAARREPAEDAFKRL